MKDINGKDHPCINCKHRILVIRKAERECFDACNLLNRKVMPNDTCSFWESKGDAE